jgi:GT2 family glycosyltransferase
MASSGEGGLWIIAGDDRTSGRNAAAARGDAPYIIFLDSDLFGVTAEAVALAIASLENGASVVSGLLERGGRVFAAGYAINHQGRPYQRFAGWSPDAAKVQERREDLQAVPIHFMATRRDVWRQIRFRPEFADWALAEADYCTRAKKAGLGPIVYEPRIRLEIEGQHLPQLTGAAVQLYVSSAGPSYDEFRVL